MSVSVPMSVPVSMCPCLCACVRVCVCVAGQASSPQARTWMHGQQTALARNRTQLPRKESRKDKGATQGTELVLCG